MLKNKIIESLRNLDDLFYNGAKTLRVLFVVTDGYGFAGQLPIILPLLKADNVTVRTTTDFKHAWTDIEFNSSEEQRVFRDLYMDSTRASLSKWHFVVSSHVNGFYPRRHALKVYIHHGPGFGTLGSKLHIARNFDIFFGLSEAERLYFENFQPDIFSNDRAFFPVGFPKDDALINSGIQREQVLEELGLDDRKTVLITSHWQSVSILRTFEEELFRQIADEFSDCNVIQTGHPWLWQPNKKQEESWRESIIRKCRDVEREFPNTRFLPAKPVDPLLISSDLLIGDHSSVMTTYSLLNRPIIFFDNPELEFASNDIRQIYREASHAFCSLDNLSSICREALVHPEIKEKGRHTMRKTFHSNPGSAGETAAQVLLAAGPICSTQSREWRQIMSLSNSRDLQFLNKSV